jgi:MFS family permease
MTFDDLVPAWSSASNAPDPAQLDRYKTSVVRRLDKDHRDFVWHVGMAGALTLLMAGGFTQYVIGGGAFDFRNEWASLIFLLLPIGVAGAFLRGYVAHRRRHPRYDLSIAAALRAMLDENRLARLRLRVSMSVLTVAMALLPVVTYQLQLVGKQRPHEAASMLAVFGLAYVVSMGWQIWKYRWKLLPENARLQDLLRNSERV